MRKGEPGNEASVRVETNLQTHTYSQFIVFGMNHSCKAKASFLFLHIWHCSLLVANTPYKNASFRAANYMIGRLILL